MFLFLYPYRLFVGRDDAVRFTFCMPSSGPLLLSRFSFHVFSNFNHAFSLPFQNPSTTNAVILFHPLQLQTSSTYQEIPYSSSRSDCSFVSLLIWSFEWPIRDSWIIPSTEISPDLFSCHILLALPHLVSSISQTFIGPSSGLRCTELFFVDISLFLVCPVIYLSHPISPT